MTALDPAEIFRAEAAELLACLEATLLDLGDRPEDRALVDTAFRALHTIKGSGAMFGFEQVAAFTHDFETAFDRVRRGEVPVGRDLVNVSLSAKDYIRGLIEEPEATPDHRRGHPGRARAAPRRQPRPPTPPRHTATATASARHPPPGRRGRGRPARRGRLADRHRLRPDVLRNGTNPLALLDELRDLGPCTVVPRLDALPELPGLDPESLVLGWDVTLRGPATRAAIEDVFLFVRDEMVLTWSRQVGAAGRRPAEARAPAPVAASPIAAAPAPPRRPSLRPPRRSPPGPMPGRRRRRGGPRSGRPAACGSRRSGSTS